MWANAADSTKIGIAISQPPAENPGLEHGKLTSWVFDRRLARACPGFFTGARRPAVSGLAPRASLRRHARAAEKTRRHHSPRHLASAPRALPHPGYGSNGGGGGAVLDGRRAPRAFSRGTSAPHRV